jgi:3-hydroxymyristoyl/3-hydroxydecanoyl-(acyl carrier protein) dehydratase
MDGARESALDVPAAHPAFEGHFPGHPILPGVVLLAELIAAMRADDAGAAREWRVESAKFASPVAPGTRLTLLRRGEGTGRVRFEIRAEARLVASGVLARVPPFAAT